MNKLLTILALFFTSLAIANVPADDVILLTHDNMVTLQDKIDDESIGKLTKDLLAIHNSLPANEPIYLYLNTPGGSVPAGEAFIAFANTLDRKIHTITDFSASMGFQIVQNLGNRYILKNGMLMSHHASLSFGSYRAAPDQFLSLLTRIKNRLMVMDKMTVLRTNGKQTMESYVNAYNHDLWIGGSDAVQQGYADKVINARCSPELLKETYNTVITSQSLFGVSSIKVEMSKCPIIKYPLEVKANVRTKKGTLFFNEILKNRNDFKYLDIDGIMNEINRLKSEGIISRDRKNIRYIWR